MRFNRIILIQLLSCFFFLVKSQTIPSKNITIEDGLPSNTIRSIYKDSRGVLWIGTESGLCCFDGINYKVYNETNGLKHNDVWSIVEDDSSTIWISIYGKGLAKYDGKRFTYYDQHDGLVHNAIRRLHYSKKHKCLIIATENGLSLFDGKKFKSFIRNEKNARFQIASINESANKILIASSCFGIYNLNINKDISKSTLDSVFQTDISYSSVVFNHHYFTTGLLSKLNVYPINLELTHLEKVSSILASPLIWDFASDSTNSLYCATWDVTSPTGGLFKYSNGKMEDISQEAGITSRVLWCLYFDQQNKILWVGSLDKGLYKVDLSNQTLFLKPKHFGLDNLQALELFNDKRNNTWIGAENYIIKLHPDLSYQIIDKLTLWNKLSSFLTRQHLNPYSESVFSQKKIKEGFSPFSIAEDNDGQIWVSTTWGVFCLDENLSITSYRCLDGGHIAFDKNDKLFCSVMYNGLFVAPKKTDLKSIWEFCVSSQSTPRDISKVISANNRLWYASSTNGLYSSIDTNFYWINKRGNFKESYIKDIAFDGKGNLIVGTNSGSVYVAKPSGDSVIIIQVFNPEKELYGSTISFVEEYDGNYIIGTNKGINVIKHNKFVKLIGRPEGLADVQFHSCVKDKSGNLFIATNTGVIKIRIDELVKSADKVTSAIVINEIKVNQQPDNSLDPLFIWNSFNGGSINLNYTQNDIEILFSQNNTFNAEKNLYRYKIVGLSSKWSQYESKGRIQLRAIPNGKYTLVMEGKNIGTGETIPARNLELIIAPPFWKTTWFLLLFLALIITTLWGLFKLRVRDIQVREKEKAELTNKLLESRLDALMVQMNPHFTFNAINSIQNFIIDKDTEHALHYLSEFSKLIRQTLENSSKKLIPLQTEINFLNSYIAIQKLRFDTVQSAIFIDKSIDTYRLAIPPLIIQPFIENAFEHAFEHDSRNCQIEINFKLESQILICSIQDNGKGYSESNKNVLHESKGIKLTKDRLCLMDKEYNTDKFTVAILNINSVASNQNGTKVTLTFPVLTNNA